MQTKHSQVGIIIPCWNKLDYTKRCIDSVLTNTGFNHFQLIGVNNGSTDGTTEYFESLRTQFQSFNGFIHVHLQKNEGFGPACNAGIKLAFDVGCSHACLLNNDVEVTPGWLHTLYDCVEREENRGLVQPVVCDFSGNVRNCGNEICTDEMKDHGVPLADLDKSLDHLRGAEKERIYLNGACLMGKKTFFDEVGLFDPAFFPAYHEETDLCIRGHIAGWKMMFCGGSVVKHHFNVTSNEVPESNKHFWDHWNLILRKYKAYFTLLSRAKRAGII